MAPLCPDYRALLTGNRSSTYAVYGKYPIEQLLARLAFIAKNSVDARKPTRLPAKEA